MKPRFSERMGLVSMTIDTNGISEALRNSLWNYVSEIVIQESTRGFAALGAPETRQREIVKAIAAGALRVPIEEVSYTSPRQWLLERYKRLPWNEALDLIEWVVDRVAPLTGNRITTDSAIGTVNTILEREHSGFRFISGELTRVIQPVEAEEVERALARAETAGLRGVQQHIEQALVLFGKRPAPDYRNAIKEAISAVEGTVKLIEGTRGGGLSDVLTALSKRMDIHPALKSGMEKLYGFTSDASGIRHPILDEPNIGEDDARFFVVACSALVNWIIAKADKAGLLKKA